LKLKESSLEAGLGTAIQHALFATTFLLMHVQGNQKPLVCLELKQHCRTTEQRKQLAQKVPHQLAANATATHRGRLYTARAWGAVTGSFVPGWDAQEPFMVIAGRASDTFWNLTTVKRVQWNLNLGGSLPGQCNVSSSIAPVTVVLWPAA
jgi:hypothetical protein